MSTVFEERDKALADYVMAQLAYQYPVIVNCEANLKLLQVGLDEISKADLDYEAGERYQLTVANLEMVLQRKPELLSQPQLALRPSATPVENAAQAQQSLREQLILQLVASGASAELRQRLPRMNAEQLQAKLTEIETAARLRLLDYDSLKREAKREWAAAHPQGTQTFEPVPASYDFNGKTYQLDSRGMKLLVRDLPKVNYELFKARHGLENINRRIATGE